MIVYWIGFNMEKIIMYVGAYGVFIERDGKEFLLNLIDIYDYTKMDEYKKEAEKLVERWRDSYFIGRKIYVKTVKGSKCTYKH